MKNEKQIEISFIEKLKELKYTYRENIKDKTALEENFRNHFQNLNRVHLSDSEFARLKENIIISDVFAAAKILRETNTFKRDDDTPLQYTLVNTVDWCKNEYEVINQLRINTESSHHRYDVIILINGIPVVQIELKSLQITPKRAMEQIVEYKNDPGNGFTNSLLCFMQLFIVSNESNTYYFANNNKEHFSFNEDERFLPIYQLAGKNNKKISHLHDFSDVFLRKCTLGELISKYMVLVASEQKMLIMRPYQIYAVKAIVDCIEQNRGNGYIWHTTGSGKTLTSFKASTLLKDNPNIAKCLFVVDRKDLDRQTREEFNKFQEGCVEENTNTESLVKRLASEDYRDKVIVTTIQKLGLALADDRKRNREKKKRGELTYKERLAPLKDQRIVIIFDECHRSQFGDNHKAIKEFFPKAQLFGFTGTPIFEENAIYKQIDGTIGSYTTTKDIFAKELHAYTITNAIDDRNVLRFHIDYFKPEKDRNVSKVSEEKNKRAIVQTILSKHDIVTNDRRYNAILATASINDAIEYYELFKEVQQILARDEDTDFQPLNLVCVFSPPADGNKDVQQIQEDLPQEKEDNKKEPDKKKKALKIIIDAYNRQYGTNYDINTFDGYYQDVQQRIKDQEYTNTDYPHENKIDITIVVDMLLTGFDSKYLNTLYVDKNLKYHGLIQAFSRTNRILNDTKPYGNILDFRNQADEVDQAIALFSGENNSKRAKEIWLVDPAPKVIEKLDKAMGELETFMKSQGLECKPEQVSNLKGNSSRCEFVQKFKEVQRLKTQLEQYTEIEDKDAAKIEELLPEDTLRAFRGAYIDVAQRLKTEQGKENGDVDSEVEQIDFEFVLFSSAIIDYDYIMALISKYTQYEPKKQKMSKAQLISMLSATSNLLDEREDIIEYIESLPVGKALNEDEIKEGYQKFRDQKNNNEINALAEKHGIEKQELGAFIQEIIERMIFDGEKLSDLLAPLDLSWRDRTKKELDLMEDLIPLLKKLANGREIVGLSAYE
ncbi:type I restriction endonuclease subunit R [Schaedlerella arabinosiphila]|uniref:type I restriction endonuclease subunit R n=1 Tax=Schaedlerella arabinosiphila TaxID=2044587 RepID=UPI002558125F|nr:type I restriction endonuclease subunit R [Schaedlerella arabinosiphila]MCI9632034.1 type I restriction endonuclease subunit R [Ruminococcus sp.]